MTLFRHLCCLAALAAWSHAPAQIPTPPQQAAALRNKLASLILPQFTFQDATLEEAIEYLRLKCKEADATPDPGARGINFVVLGPKKKKLTLQLRSVPASEALRFITELAGMGYLVEPHAIVIGSKNLQMRNPAPKLIAVRGQEATWQRFILPTAQFEKATIAEACEYLTDGVRRACDFDGDRPPFNILLKHTPEAKARSLSLDLRGIPVSETLRYFAELSGLKLRYDREAIVLAPHDDKPAIIQLRGKGTAKLRADPIVLPTVSFENVSVVEVAEFFRLKTAEVDPAKKGIQIILSPEIDPKAACSLDLRRISTSEALRYAAWQMNLKLSADDHAFLLSNH